MQAVEGLIPFHHESFPSDFHSQTWYKIIGDRNSEHPPLIVLHGGPGYTHHYLKPTFQLFARQTSTPVVFYDQIGNGNSTHIRDRRLDEAFWNVDLFVAELQNLVAKLGLQGGFSLYGHSWGAMLALKYVAMRQPQGLQKIVLGSGPASMALSKNAARGWISALPPRQAALLEEYRMGSIQSSTKVDHPLEELDKLTTLMKEPFPREL
ncbi:peptidase tricorn interacting factor 1 [Colletotrichum asianum]|uniref:Peptidase tricorn interacting factor 1 n=1 Tax=Colletotrichum asianum TaxID=702518 RepID=A0A8H3ZHV3_9PEZI|nr:peptidase tricorn interacting factor 1 [Colletotrichum asianum]